MKSEIIKYVVGIEGGYVDHADDPGGRTRWGITEEVARANGYRGPMSELSVDEAVGIYETEYWDALNLNDILRLSPAIAFEMFDAGVNTGVSRAGRWLQEALNKFNRKGADYADIAEDGDVGPKTIATLEMLLHKRGKVGEVIVWRALNCLQGIHYFSLGEKFESFQVGWFTHRVGVLPTFLEVPA